VQIQLDLNPYGLSQSASLLPVWTKTNVRVGFQQLIPAQPDKGITVTPGLAWDRTGGRYRGRLYLVYTDRTNTTNVDDTDVYVMHSDNNGATWPNKVRVNTDSTTTSQFFPRIAVDQTTGKVAASWYDCRADTLNNRKARFYAAVSSDGGATFSSINLQLEGGQSDATLIAADSCFPSPAWPNQFDYFDYTGSAFYGGYFYSAWTDNSASVQGNPDGSCGMDIYVAKVHF
jgi:hypothetical protein